jgi:transcriptional regulator with XRE-family HTH domain
MAKGKVGKTVESLGDYLKEQRVASRLSLRQLAEQAGVSNPYLSQIERGLRRPSAEVLQQIAKALRISAEQLYIRAGILSPEEGAGGPTGSTVELAVLSDSGLTERQKQSLLDVYSSFLALNAAANPTANPLANPLANPVTEVAAERSEDDETDETSVSPTPYKES